MKKVLILTIGGMMKTNIFTCFIKFFIMIAVIINLKLVAQENEQKEYEKTIVWYSFEENEKFEVKGSKYFLEKELKAGYYDGIPKPLKYVPGENSEKSFGVNASWSRQGHNWFDILPLEGSPNYKKAFPGKLKALDLWVWGANYNYDLYVTLENEAGYAYDFKISNLRYFGWKHIKVNIPAAVALQKTYIAKEQGGLLFRRFRVYSGKDERVDYFSIFLDYFRIFTDLYDGKFDGIEMQNVFFNRGSGFKKEVEEKK